MDTVYNGDTLYMDTMDDGVRIGVCDGGKEASTHLTHDEAAILGAQLLRSRLEKVEALLARALGDGGIRTSVAAADDGEVRQALTEVRSMLKETT